MLVDTYKTVFFCFMIHCAETEVVCLDENEEYLAGLNKQSDFG